MIGPVPSHDCVGAGPEALVPFVSQSQGQLQTIWSTLGVEPEVQKTTLTAIIEEVRRVCPTLHVQMAGDGGRGGQGGIRMAVHHRTGLLVVLTRPH